MLRDVSMLIPTKLVNFSREAAVHAATRALPNALAASLLPNINKLLLQHPGELFPDFYLAWLSGLSDDS